MTSTQLLRSRMNLTIHVRFCRRVGWVTARLSQPYPLRPTLLPRRKWKAYNIGKYHSQPRRLPMAEVSTRLYWLCQSLIAFMPYLLVSLLAGAIALAMGVFLARFLLWDWLL